MTPRCMGILFLELLEARVTVTVTPDGDLQVKYPGAKPVALLAKLKAYKRSDAGLCAHEPVELAPAVTSAAPSPPHPRR